MEPGSGTPRASRPRTGARVRPYDGCVDYCEALPSVPLRAHVRRFWGLTDTSSEGARGIERVVPDGRMELIVHLGDPFTRLCAQPNAGVQPRALLAGQLVAPLLLLPGRSVDVFAIRFEPWGASALLGVEPGPLLQRLPPLADLLGSDAERLGDALARAAGFVGRVQAAERWCQARLSRARPPAAALVAAARAAAADASVASVADLARRVGWGARRLERGFAEHVGLTPKALLRVSRLQRLLARLTEPRRLPSLAVLALEGGYADQAHMTREFGALVGTSPARYRAEAHDLQDAILDPRA